MLNQMFTAENFRRIFNTENRKGLDLGGRFFPELNTHTQDIQASRDKIRKTRSQRATFNPEKFNTKITKLKEEFKRLKSAKSDAIDEEMKKISSEVLKPEFELVLTKKNGPQGKPVYCIDGTPQTYFTVKQLQRNINRTYGVKQSNRHDIVCQLRDTVASRFPFEIVRTDVSDFYESINRDRLLKKLDEDHLLNSSSKKYIRQILESYGNISGSDKGIPRGVGVSAYLGELFLRPVDRKIREIPNLVLYCRFVDDIVAVFARPPSGVYQGSYKDRILKEFSKWDLSHNHEKTKEIDLSKPGEKEFDYLGYRFILHSNKWNINPSATKIDKYKMRINAAFKDYERQSSQNSRRAYRDLVSRVKYLTGNTRLANSKSSVVTGIYFNNSIVTDLSNFELLDQYLRNHVQKIRRSKLRKRLKKYKFTDGFTQRKFHNFSAQELQAIVSVWKHV